MRVLKILESTNCAPKLLRHFKVWEHNFIEIEYIDGQSLSSWRNEHFPFDALDASTDEKTKYKTKALKICESIISSIEQIHRKGVVIGDVHPGNILIKPDGSLVFIDFEDVRDQASIERATFNALFFAAPAGRSPIEGDWYSASRVLASLFDPRYMYETLSPEYWKVVLNRVGADFGQDASNLIDSIAKRSGSTRTEAVDLTPIYQPLPVQLADNPEDRHVDRSDVTKDRIVDGIIGSKHATPGALFPGNVEIFENALGAVNVSSGAAGVLWSLLRSGYTPPEADLQWIADTSIAIMRSSRVDLGLFEGLTGIAGFLTEVGFDRHSEQIWAHILANAGRLKSINLSRGLSSIGLGMLALGVNSGKDVYVEMSRAISDLIVDRADPRQQSLEGHPSVAKPGLLEGWSGASLLWTALANIGDDSRDYHDLALSAIMRDLDRTAVDRNGALGVRDEKQNRSLPYLGWGTAGILFALAVLATSNPEAMRAIEETTFDAAIRACSAELYVMPGLYRGRAGIITALAALKDVGIDYQKLTAAHTQRLAESAFIIDKQLHFAGDYALRLSDDYGTGGAGILAALNCLDTSGWNIIPVVNAPVSLRKRITTRIIERR